MKNKVVTSKVEEKSFLVATNFMFNLVEMIMAKSNKKGIRLQKRQYIQKYLHETFIITIERGDKLNNEVRNENI